MNDTARCIILFLYWYIMYPEICYAVYFAGLPKAACGKDEEIYIPAHFKHIVILQVTHRTGAINTNEIL